MTATQLMEYKTRKRMMLHGTGARTRSSAQSLAAADLYRVLAKGFTYPEDDHIASMRRALGALVAEAEQGRLSVSLVPALRAARRAWLEAGSASLEDEYSRLFLGSGLVPLREGGYGDGLRFAGQPFDIADLSGFYLAFGFGPPPTAASPPDHLGTELEYLSLLNLKAALATERGRWEEGRVTRLAMASFLADHLARWISGVEAAMREADAAPAFKSLSALLCRAIDEDCRRLGVNPVPQGRGNASDPVGADTLECPLAAVRDAPPQFQLPGASQEIE